MSVVARRVERFLLAAGLMILGYCGADWLNSHLQQRKGNQELDRLLRNQSTAQSTAQGSPRIRKAVIPDGSLVGKVEIPKLHLSAIVFQGTDSEALDRGVGHLDESALPGQPGNVVLAAHRDTYFRSLRSIRKGDEVRVTTPNGVRTYRVDSTEIVTPTQTSVMDPTPEPTLTLITCYPFYYVGHAPKRFIVRALDTSYRPPRIVAQKKVPQSPLSSEDDQKLTYVFRASGLEP